MKKCNLCLFGLLHAVLVAVYVFLVSLIMRYGETWFGPEMKFMGPFAILMLLVLSAAVVGSLVFAKSILFYLDGRKKEAVHLLLWTIGWLFVIVILTFIVLALV